MFVKWSADLLDLEERFACLVGTCAGHDGRSASLTAPNGPAQQDVVRRSMKMADLDPSLISICECHGTGTALGDPIEVGALQGVMRGMRSFPLLNTATKTNTAHLEGTAGMAGILKCVYMALYSCGPPNCHLRTLNSNLLTEGYPVFFVSESCDTTFTTSFNGVSSFGFGGTNSRADVYGRCLYGAKSTGNVWTEERLSKRALAYAHSLRNSYNGYDKVDASAVARVPVSIIGSWDNFEVATEMKQEEPGCFTHRVTLGDTCRECFQLCLAGDRSRLMYPAVDMSSSKAKVCGPSLGSSSAEEGNKWLIDGRQDAAHERSTYLITFRWQGGEKRISWEVENTPAITDHDQQTNDYYILGSWNQWDPRKMSCQSEDDGLYEADIIMDMNGVASFQLRRGDDAEHTIYPGGSGPVSGPPKASQGKQFTVKGEEFQTMTVQLKIKYAHTSVSVFSDGGIKRVWASRHVNAYYVSGSFNDWKAARLHEDNYIKGLHRYYMTVQSDEPVEYKIFVDAGWFHELQGFSAVFPEAERKVLDATRDFKGKVGSSWEVIVDLNQDDPERMIYHRPATRTEDNTVISNMTAHRRSQ
mmetsp:Transcript_98708/g.185477  ORF Transcript_98708/g.185477 Transcript_98708/m.185477 type:complete len:586 (+) Transcript_98708:3-1760(+)